MTTGNSELWSELNPPLVILAQPDATAPVELAEKLDGYRLRFAKDGEEALRMARETPPDAMIVDLHTPGVSGVEICRRMRADPDLCWVPLGLTIPRDDNAIVDAIQAGAAEVIATPFSPVELRLRLRNMVRGRVYLDELERKNKVITQAYEDLKQSEEMLVQAEKLTCLGEMSAGIVHEINNPLNYSKSAIFILRKVVEDLDDDETKEEMVELVGDVSEGVERVGRIIRDLRSFAMKGTVQVGTVDLADVVRTVTRLMGARLGNLQFREDVEEGLLLRGNENNICQVLLNLVKNGVEATEERGLNQREAELRLTAREVGDHIELRVRDNGCGLSADQQQKIFEPFFTTKDRGRGMGLGLSICRRIIEDHGGTIEVESEEGSHTEFALRFPTGDEGTLADGNEAGVSKVRAAVMDYED